MAIEQPLYCPLSHAREIRVLEILSHPGQEMVTCRLHTVSLDSKPYFVCLSYVWGNASVREEIIADGKPMQVTVNLAAALRSIKKHWIEIQNEAGGVVDVSRFRLWADAVCINQDDLSERSAQVQLMRDIYSSADFVLAWLSLDDQPLSGAFEMMKHVLKAMKDYSEVGGEQLPDLDDPALEMDKALARFKSSEWAEFLRDSLGGSYASLCENERQFRDSDPWNSLINLPALPFWCRIWTQQETVLARKLYYLCPSKRLSSSKFVAAIHSLLALLRGLADVEPKAYFKVRQLVTLIGNILVFVKLRHFNHDRDLQRLHMLRVSFISMKATDPLDYAYGLLGLSGLDIVTDYTRPVCEVYVEYSHKLIDMWQLYCKRISFGRETGCLCFLQSCAAGINRDQNLPIWASAFSTEETKRATSTLFRGKDDRISRGVPQLQNCPPVSVVGTSLWVTAVKAQTITSQYPRPLSPEFFCDKNSLVDCIQSFLTSHGPTYVNGESLLTVLCCTLLGRQEGQYNIRKLCHYLSRIGSFNSRIFEKIDKQGLAFAQKGLGQETIIEDQVVPGTMLSRCRLVSTEDGYIGLTGEDVREGDVVCVLAGCNAPAILRPESGHYLFVGCCFMLGFMDGEVADLLKDGRAKVEVVEVR
ncbi:heterokaryon incompatibility [Fusarium albosuccineum]|uniref:Heterokaryon incompatibility n=1 Tax=Fusarium albosuccineum TaxID=1237068 RepID=A0A8H4LFI7_9HYPO|nr:heterokaryon incompatibility [Fusarium albosuccineum]